MRGETSVRAAEDLESGALTYAEIKAIASGNPAVVEKIKIDTEVRKLDQLRAVHANQQRHIRWEIDSAPDLTDDLDLARTAPPEVLGRHEIAKMAETYMRESKAAIREMPIIERTPPQSGPVTGKAVAKDEEHIAIATAANSFFVVPSTLLDRDVQIGERLSLRFYEGRASIENRRNLGR